MANVGFYNTSQEKIEGILKSQKSNNFNNNITEGSFYLTEKNKLYIGRKNASNNILIEPINAGITPVADFNTLQTLSGETGEFYYIESDNILCVRSGNSWVQINAIVTNTHVNHSASNVEDTDGNSTNVVKVSTEIHDSRAGNPATGDFTITGSKGIKVTGEGSLVTIMGDPISVESSISDNAITTTFKSENGATDGTFKLKGGSNITIEKVENNNVISAVDTYVENIIVENASEGTTGFNINASLSNAEYIKTMGHLDPVITFSANVEAPKDNNIKFNNGVAILPVYTAREVDDIKTELEKNIADTIRNFNAMVYRGTVGPNGSVVALPTKNVMIGDAYLASDVFNDGVLDWPAGTLFIATGEEEEDSDYIKEGEVIWTKVTGSTADTIYHGEIKADGSLGIYSSTDVNTPIASVNVTAGNETIEVETTPTEGKYQVYSIKHKDFGDSTYIAEGFVEGTPVDGMEPGANGYEINTIAGIKVENGHVTEVISAKYSVVDSNTIISPTPVLSGLNNQATITLQTANNYKNDEFKDAVSFGVKSNSLSITTAENDPNIAINLTWGTF